MEIVKAVMAYGQGDEANRSAPSVVGIIEVEVKNEARE